MAKDAKKVIDYEAYDLDVDDCDKPRAVFYQFKEHSEILKLIENFPDLINDLRAKELSYGRFLFICDSYQEQPHLIDPFLREILENLIKIVKSSKDDNVIHEAFKYMYCVTKMRGYKKVVQHLPHEVVDLEPVLELLSRQDINDHLNWQTRYMLLLWLSIVSMIPFDLSRFDAEINEKHLTIMTRILNLCTPYLFVSDKCQDAAAYLLAKFMSRVDVCKKILPEFYQNLLNLTSEAKNDGHNFKLLGVLKCIAAVLKYGKREDVLSYAIQTMSHFMQLSLTSVEVTVIRKYYIKIIQRIGLTLFKEKIARWRYERGSRLLVDNLKQSESNKTTGVSKTDEVNENDGDEDDAEIPEEVEDIIEQLLLGLKDRDTIVRWSAAKGIGRITNRLSRNMAEDILNSILENFTFVEDDSAWHGGCLAVAELGRRGLLLPKQLNRVVPIIVKALIFDKKLGNYSIGRNVRDSACYVCWSLARAFEPSILKPYVNDIANSLLITTVFDREVNCRRAASAAFQENVGRQGQFPHGIDILTKADYFAVNNLNNCYLNLSVFVAQFDEYKEQLITHLLEHKFNHWDAEIREVTSQALYNLTSLCPEYMSKTILNLLLNQCLHFDLNTRHGAILSLSQIIHALSNHANENNINKNVYFSEEFLNEIKTLISRMQEANFFRGLGGEVLRPSICMFIKKIALSKLFDVIDNTFLKTCDSFLNECFEYDKEAVQNAAVEVVPHLCNFYVKNNNEFDTSIIVKNYIEKLNTSKEYLRCGYLLALGNLPKSFLKNNIQLVVDNLINMSKTNKNNATWVRSRKDAIRSLIIISKSVQSKDDLIEIGLDKKLITRIFECFFDGLNDYTIDSKGDSGSKVREISIEALEVYSILCGQYSVDVLDEIMLTQILGGVMKQAVERIDRTRNLAGVSFQSILYNQYLSSQIEKLSYSKELYTIFKKSYIDLLEWNVPSDTFPLFAKTIKIENIQSDILLGFVFSIGALTESVVKSSTKSFIKELQEINSANKSLFIKLIKNLYQLTQTNIKSERLTTSFIKTVDLIIQYNLFNDKDLMNENIPADFLNIFIENCRGSTDIQKLIAYIDLFCDMLQFYDKLRERSMVQLMMMLCHQYPRIRKAVASKLYETMLNYSDLIPEEENTDEVISLLTETDWDQPLDIIRPIRNRLCDLTNTPKPVLKAKK